MNAIKEINDFESYLRNIKNRSEKTIKAYSSDLLEFCLMMNDKLDLNEIKRSDIENIYIANLVNSGNGPASRARKISSLRSFFKWAKSNNIVRENPAEDVELPKLPQKKPKIMSHEEVYDTILCAKYGDDTEPAYESFRNLAIIMIMFSTGIRRAELTEIKVTDVNLSESSLLIHGKGNKERIVYFNDATRAVLSEYINSHRKQMKFSESSDYLFISRKSEKLNVATINRIVNKYLEEAGIKNKGFTAHSTRKAFATTVYENTRDIYVVQNLLGHSSPVTTQKYVGINESNKKKAAMSMSF